MMASIFGLARTESSDGSDSRAVFPEVTLAVCIRA
jgi:hypothetical protein